MADKPKVPARTANAALALRLAGAGYDEVADMLGLPNALVARQHAETALEARAWEDVAGRERMRAENGARLERLLRSVWSKATNPDDPEHLAAVRAAKDVIDRHCRLYGLDAPAEIIVHSPTAHEIDAWVAGMIAASTEDLRAMEPPVIDVEGQELTDSEVLA